MTITYGSVCSGIEAASVAWHCLGWQPAWFAEIEKFPSAVLSYRWPDVTNLGDMTKISAAISGSNSSPAIMKGMAVRRLTPVECERLQGFPDNHTLIPIDKRKQITADEYAYVRHHNPQITAEEAYRQAKDGPRYKAIGNSMAVPVMRWIGKRIAAAINTAGEGA